MKKIKVLLDFIKFTIIEKINFYRNVNEKMTDNPNFPNPDVPMAEATIAVNKLEAAQLAALGGDRTAIAFMHKCEEEADEVFRKQADYVNRVGNGDEAILLGSGFHISKEPTPRQVPEFSVKLGEKPGSVLLKRHAVPGAKSYIWQKCIGELPATDDGWTLAGVSSQASYDVEGLPSAVRAWFRVAVVTSEGTSSFSVAISVVTQ
jgi:hypothetical protein